MFPTPIQKRIVPVRALYVVGVILLLIMWLLPMVAIVSTSIRPGSDISSGNYWGIPSRIAIVENYSEVFNPDRSPMLRYFINSTVMTLPAVFFTILFSSMAGFALAVYPFKGRIALYAMFIAGNFIPYQILMIPVRTMFVKFGLFDTIIGLVIFHTAFQSGFATFFLRNFIVELPFSLVESARVEGATEPRIFFSIMIPLLRPALASLGVLLFTFIWNDFFWALTLVQSDKARPITFGLSALKGQWLISWNLIAAGSVVAALPSVVVFFILQKQFIQGLTFGGVKE
ncbi:MULTISPECIES: carbohydrate ABC transporter permease [unclassified Oceanispirochaeta]|uniref:carbohydrate ABC transporter permease n=1 Tax=unclassified Oceanispirochaeta TaxID=2635722 RepID=UPI000E09A07E|nr:MULTISPECIES: carbohydrate ABC transporter permease [unclassified Oceanispirochaeta]MBF9014095.1 carbohydrate ABC transporter permease [Oceanispirochaeta sp. M2]NPD70586.1 carbohydrate ABC transporter permease [Oceanispirochaeta sp. M1]RDG34351.1 carbohydrate ABC transporter permease [Oceanispirochaeta sp. M1]